MRSHGVPPRRDGEGNARERRCVPRPAKPAPREGDRHASPNARAELTPLGRAVLDALRHDADDRD